MEKKPGSACVCVCLCLCVCVEKEDFHQILNFCELEGDQKPFKYNYKHGEISLSVTTCHSISCFHFYLTYGHFASIC